MKIGDKVQVRTGPWKGRRGMISAISPSFVDMGDSVEPIEPEAVKVDFMIGEHTHTIELLIVNLGLVKS
ncbi:MAG: hypothetical protein K8H84_07900 [Sulfuricella denitrificans]|nr:hypothetical protein [Sulfuricella denitrificans]